MTYENHLPKNNNDVTKTLCGIDVDELAEPPTTLSTIDPKCPDCVYLWNIMYPDDLYPMPVE